jgi:CRP-like cAMP-binding protein
MSATSIMPYSTTNRVLLQLPGDVLSAMRPYLTRVRLVFGQVLIEAGSASEHVFFPEVGVVSLVAGTSETRPGVQVAMVGRVGMVGALALLGPAAPNFVSAVSQIPGPALRISVHDLKRLFEQYAPLRDACMMFFQTLIAQTMQNAAYNAQRSLSDRCVRWLLMTDERVDRGELPITHEALSRILGVRRAGVTVVASALQEEGLIRVSRGRITILNRAGLERLAGDFNGSPDANRELATARDRHPPVQPSMQASIQPGIPPNVQATYVPLGAA